MLETVHEYAWEQMEQRGEVEWIRDRHAAYYAAALAQWAATYWMPEELHLEPGSGYGGIVIFVAPRPLPVSDQAPVPG